MALSPEARARLQQIVEQGGFAPLLSIGISDHTPEADSQVTASWDFREFGGGLGELRVGDQRWAVPAAGHRTFPVAGAEIAVQLFAGGQTAEAVVRPRVIKPIIRTLGAAGSRVAEKPVRIFWATSLAETCDLSVTHDGVELLRESVAADGERLVTPTRAGLMKVTLVARSRHARFGERATQTRDVTERIAAPPVEIDIAPERVGGQPGQEVRFSWRVSGTEHIHLLAPGRNRRFRIRAQGEAFVNVGFVEELLIVQAEALDGRRVTKIVRVIPTAPDLSLPADFLQHLNRPWNERPL